MGGFAIGTTGIRIDEPAARFSPPTSGVDEPTAGHAISAYALGVVLGAPLIAVLGARFARRTQLLVLMAVFALGNGAHRPGSRLWLDDRGPLCRGIAAWRLFRHRRAGRSVARSSTIVAPRRSAA